MDLVKRMCTIQIKKVNKLVTSNALDANIGDIKDKITNHDVHITTEMFNKLT